MLSGFVFGEHRRSLVAIDEGNDRYRAGYPRPTEGDMDELRHQLRIAQERSDRLADTLREARDQIIALKEEVDRLAEPPAVTAYSSRLEDGTVDVYASGRKIRVTVSPTVNLDELQAGQEVMPNEAMNVVAACGFERRGEIVTLKEVLEDGERALVVGRTDEERVVLLAAPL